MSEQQAINKDVLDRLANVKIVEGFEVPEDFPIPVRDGVFLDRNNRVEKDTVTKGGIIIPDTTINSSYKAVLVAVGPLCPTYFRPGMMVMYNSAVQAEVMIDGRPYTPCSYYDILCVLPPRTILLDGTDADADRKEKSLKRNAKALNHKIIE